MPEPVLNDRRRVLASEFSPPDQREEYERSEQQLVSAISAHVR